MVGTIFSFESTFWTAFGIVFPICAFIIFEIWWASRKSAVRKLWESRREAIKKEDEKFTEKVKKLAKFSPDYKVVVNAYYNSSTPSPIFRLLIDFDNKELVFASFEEDYTGFNHFSFDEISNFRIIDGVSETSSESYSNGGGVYYRGIAVGSSSTTTYSTTTKEKVQLKIDFKNIRKPSLFCMISKFKVDVTSDIYQELIQSIEKIRTGFERILECNAETSEANDISYSVEQSSISKSSISKSGISTISTNSISANRGTTTISAGKVTQSNGINSRNKAAKSQPIPPELRRAEMLIEDEEFEKADRIVDDFLLNHPESAKAYILSLLIELKLKNEEELDGLANLQNYKQIKHALKFADPIYKDIIETWINDNPEAVEQRNSENYQKAMEYFANKDYDSALNIFSELGDYEDSLAHKESCQKEIIRKKEEIENANRIRLEQLKAEAEHKKEEDYQNAKKCFADEDYDRALALLDRLKGYKDVDSLILEYKEYKIRENMYQTALKLLRTYDKDDEKEAYKILKSLNDYKNAKELLKHGRKAM